MSRRQQMPGSLRAFLVVAITVFLAVTGAQAASAAGEGQQNGIVAPDAGPLREEDGVLLANLRLVGIWQAEAGQLAARKASTPQLKETAQRVTDLYNQMNTLTVNTARELDIPLPTQPTNTQRLWLDELSGADGATFDALYVKYLRETDGRILPALGMERVGTQNDTIRELTQKVNSLVLNHMTLLERTDLVDWTAIPPAADPASGTVIPKTRKGAHGGAAMPLVWMVLLAGVVGLAVAGGRLVRPSTFGDRQIGRRPARRREPAVRY